MVNWFFFVLCLLIVCPEVWAGEGSSWRAIYDPIMKWINFGILAFVLYKYGKGPVKKFIGDQRRIIEEQMGSLESQLREESLKLEAENQKLRELDSYLQELKNRIIEFGKREKQQIIEEAKKQANLMLSRAEAEASGMIHRAKDRIRQELVERAVVLCENELKKTLSVQDQLRFLERFIEDIKTFPQASNLF